MKYSYISHLYCPKCGNTFDTKEQHQLCSCGSPLLVDYLWDDIKANWKREDLESRESSLWRYHEMLPVEDESNVVSQGEGMTPLVPMPRLGKDMGVENLFMKD